MEQNRPISHSDSPGVAKLRRQLETCKVLHMDQGAFTVACVEEALSLIDALKRNADERERIMHLVALQRAS